MSKTPSQLYSVDERVQMWEDRLRICHYCDKKVAKPGTYSGKKTTFDHIVPQAKGGSDDVDNLVLCCARCNSEKGKKDYIHFLTDRRKQAAIQVERLNQLIVAFYSKQV